MSKEMIISVNGREKKIAILDDGRVSEFYIERGEENSGVVGNIYKGRVMRVLPGMQSAFVEIGLERDAFLYVSDFFDEEEEIERIIMEKSKKESPEIAAREVSDQIQKARLEREKQMEAVQAIAEPMVESAPEILIEDKLIEEKLAQEKQPRDNHREKSRQGRRDREPRPAKNVRHFVEESQKEVSKEEKETSEQIEPQEVDLPFENAPVIETADSRFERIIDDEETTGDMFKDAYMQEAIIDQVRAIEFDMESAATTEVGSLIGSVADEPNGFERIADDDEEQQSIKPQPSKRTRGSRGGRSGKKSGGKENRAVETEDSNANADSAKKNETEGKSKQARSSKTKKESNDDESKEQGSNAPSEQASVNNAKSKSGSNPKSRKRNRGGKKTDKNSPLADAEASVKEPSNTAEMAVRRGGRGRRRPGGTVGTRPEQHSRQDEKDSKVEETAESGYQGDNGNRRNNRERAQPTITDLLREGQEILVQIAKEPIAKKGARITSHIALPGRFLVYMPTIEHLGVSRKIESASERARLRTLIQKIRQDEDVPSGGFIVRTAGTGISEEDLRQDARYLVRTWLDVKKASEKKKSPALVHQDLDIIQRLLRDQLSDEFTAIRVDSEEEYLRIVEFVNRIQPRMVKRVKLYTRDEPILESYNVQEEVDKALKPRVWLKSGGYLVINQTEALVAIDVNTGKFVGKGGNRLEDTITKTNMEAVDEIARQIRLRDLGGIIVLDLIDMEDRRNRNKVAQALQEALASDKSPNKVLSFNDFGLIIMTRKRVKQSLERTMCAPCDYCEGAGWVKSPQTVCYEILEEARRLAKSVDDVRHTTLRIHPDVAQALRSSEELVLEEIEEYLGSIDITGDKSIHQEQFDFAFI
ncbi:MAG: Rne/Rng family ribonuclease [Acidobacteria bacterium]|nr:Rne/Rng family ribonuclease [Acidobacteriota bacterium]MCA1638794.1 Rne/Rng family ribonuclease [Acidobacteriota bacterium]